MGKNYPVIEKAEMENILSNMNTDDPLCIKGKAIIELAYSSALRPREIYGLKIPDIRLRFSIVRNGSIFFLRVCSITFTT